MATLIEMVEQVRADLDMDDDTFITDLDIRSWLNMAIRVAESNIHTLYEDYFLASETIPIVAGTGEYEFPSDIFANKIRSIIFDGGDYDTHEVKPVKSLVDVAMMDKLSHDSTNPTLLYKPVNNASGRMIKLFPSTSRNGDLEIWYIRNATKLVDDDDSTDIDEFSDYLIQYAKTKALLKDGHPDFQVSKLLEDELKLLMIETLSDMTPDQNNKLYKDTSSYDEQGVL